MKQSYLKYRLNQELFCVPVTQVLKILEIGPVTQVPNAPFFMKGVLNWRGSILPVVDFNAKLGFGETRLSKDSCIVVLEIDNTDAVLTLGCIVNKVEAVLELEESELLPSPSIGDKYRSEFISGMFPEEEHFLILLDYQSIFGSEESLQLSKNSFKEITDQSNNV